MIKEAKPSVRSIAASLDLSPITVSRVLSGHPRISPETRDKVLDEVKKVGYDFFSRSKILKRQRDCNVVIHCGEDKLVRDRIFGFYSDLYYRCVKRLHAEKFHAHLADFNEHADSAFEALDKSNNLILLGPIRESCMKRIRREYPRLPIISYGGNTPDVLQVGCSDFAGGALAAEKLFEYGHRRVAVLVYLNEEITRKRFGGFHATFLAKGGEVDSLVFDEVGSLEADDRRRTEILDEYLKRPKKDRGTAFFCPLGYYALFLTQYLAARDIRIPRDFSIVSYDNFELFDHMNPPLARVWFSTKDLVIQIVDALQKFRNSPVALPASIEIAPVFTMNESLAKNRPSVSSRD